MDESTSESTPQQGTCDPSFSEKAQQIFTSGLQDFRLHEYDLSSQISDKEQTISCLEKEIRTSHSTESKQLWNSGIIRAEKRRQTLIKRLAQDEKLLLDGLDSFFKESMTKIKEG